MGSSKISYGVKRLLALHPTSILINLVGAAITYVWFSQIQPGLAGVSDLDIVRERAIFVVILIITVLGVTLPYEFRWFGPLIKEFRALGVYLDRQDLGLAERNRLAELSGKILNVPVRISITSAGAWLLASLIIAVFPRFFPEYFPWDPSSSTKIAVSTILLRAPFAVAFSYFALESLVRRTVQDVFPPEALLFRPKSVQIRTVYRLLAVSLMIGIIPPILIAHVTLRQVTDIRMGYCSIDQFATQMPIAIVYLLIVSISLAIFLSIFLAHSVSEPLRKTESAMNRIRKGDLDSNVPVVSNDEIGALGEGFNRMVDGLKERDYIRETFGSYISEAVVTQILESPEGVKLGGELREITILVSDLRGFTRMTDSMEPQKVIRILNRYFEKMTEVVVRHEGTINEFTGDGILVFFGAPTPKPDHRLKAVACALGMQEALQEMNKENALEGWPELRMGISINTGTLVVGNIGSEKRKKYGAVGTPINVAFRVEAFAASGEIVLTPSVYEELLDCLELGPAREAKIKGFDEPITLRTVQSMKKMLSDKV